MIEMKKAKKPLLILMSVVLSPCVLAGGVLGVISVCAVLDLHSLSKLSLDDAPGVKYTGFMPESDEIFEYVKALTSLGARVPGTQAHRKATQYLTKTLNGFGLENVHTVNSNTILWTASRWGLAVGGIKMDSHYMTHSFETGETGVFATPEGGLQAEIVYVGEGDESDFRNVDVRGKIVVSDVVFGKVPISLVKFAGYLFYDPYKTIPLLSSKLNPYSANTYPYNYYNAMKNGAVGFVGILSDYIDSCRYNNEDYSYLGGPMKLPGLWVSKSGGEQLKKQIAAGYANAVMTLVGERKTVLGNAVVATLPGKSKETILVHSHFDSSTTGAVEDASGTSIVLALAKYFSQIPAEDRDKTILFALMDTHFTDYDTHDAFIAAYIDGKSNILADVCIEHIANEYITGKDGNYALTGLPEPRIIFVSKSAALVKITKEEIVRHKYGRTVVLPATILGEDMPTDADMFYQEGLPVISMITAPIYLYDDFDTDEMVAKDELRPTADVFANIILRLLKLPIRDFS
jgi:hypothetical protein